MGKNIVAIPDIHFPGHDPKAVGKLLKALPTWAPGHVVILGDLLDLYGCSKFDANEPVPWDLKHELELAGKFLQRLRNLAPKAQIHLCEGNHEMRLRKYLCRRAKELFALDQVTIPAMLKLPSLGISWIPEGRRLNLQGIDFTHGWVARQAPGSSAWGQLQKTHFQRSVVVGHCHRLAQIHVGEHLFGIEAGWLGDEAHPAFDYHRGGGWCKGYAVIENGQPRLVRL